MPAGRLNLSFRRIPYASIAPVAVTCFPSRFTHQLCSSTMRCMKAKQCGPHIDPEPAD